MNEKQAGEALIETMFHLDSVVPVADPNGRGTSWFRYVISQGSRSESTITGTKSGSRADVQLQLRETLIRLNERFGKLQGKKK
jgi:hypothetical protein